MKYFLSLLFFSLAPIYTFSQSIEGIWLAKYSLEATDSSEYPDFSRTAGIFDFFNKSEFLIYNGGFGNDHLGKYKKLKKGKYRLKTPRFPDHILEIIDSMTIKISPANLKDEYDSKVMICERIHPDKLKIDLDSVKSIISSNIWSIERGYRNFSLEIADSPYDEILLYYNRSVNRSTFGIIDYKGYFFFGFFDTQFIENYVLQLNDFMDNQFISYTHNFDDMDDQNMSLPLVMQMENKPELSEINQKTNLLVGKWEADVTNWKETIRFNDSTFLTRTLKEGLSLDSVVYNCYKMEFHSDSTYTFINEGILIQNSEKIFVSDTTIGRWKLNSTFKYLELSTPYESPELILPGQQSEYSTYVLIYDLSNESVIFDFRVGYSYLLDGIRIKTIFKKTSEYHEP